MKLRIPAHSWILMLLLSACASPPEHLYALERASNIVQPAAAGVPTVIVGPVSIPELVDRPQIVVREGDFAVRANEQERWASPLKESLTRLLAAQLALENPARRFLPAFSVSAHPVEARLTVDFTELSLRRGGGAVLVARWSFRYAADDRQRVEGQASGRAEVQREGYPGLVDALNRATGALAKDIAQQLQLSWQQSR